MSRVYVKKDWHGKSGLRPRQISPEFQRAFPYPLIITDRIPLGICRCSWGWSPAMCAVACEPGPFVLKFFHSGCPTHSVRAHWQRKKDQGLIPDAA